MPTYVYRRPDGTTFEVFQKISEDALTEDPTTGVPVSRVISGGAGLQFKGDGFYITDYVNKGGAGSADATGDAGATESAAPSETSSSGESAAATTSDDA